VFLIVNRASYYMMLLTGQNILDPNTAELWVASRVFDRSQTVGDRLGRNEKTKVINSMAQSCL
jgi:hypothetical protein